MNKTTFLLLVSLLAVSPAAYAQEVPPPAGTPLKLRQVIELALKTQPSLATASANREVSAQRLKQVNARFLPTVTPSYTYLNQYSFGKVSVFQQGGVVTQLPQGRSTTTRQEQLNFSMTVLDNGERKLNSRQASQSLRASELSEENTRQSIIGNVASAYFAALRADRLVDVSSQQVTRSENALAVIQAQVEAKLGARKDIRQAEADLLNARVNLITARNNAEIAHAQLKNAIGLTSAGRLTLADVSAPGAEMVTTVAVATRPEDGAIGRLVSMAYEQRPDLSQSQRNVDASATGVKLARLSTLPQFTASVSGGYQFDAANDPTRSLGNNRLLNISASYPLFDGGLVRSQLRSSAAQQRASEAQLASLKLQVAVEVEQAYRTLFQAWESLPAAKAAQEAAQINYDAALEAFKLGAGSIVEVITAQTQLVQAQTNYVQAIYSFYSADASLARSVGQADRIGQADTR